MEQRIDLRELERKSYDAMLALEKSVAESGIDARTRHLVKLRASMLNGCAFCVDMHSEEGKRDGVPDAHLFGVAAWQESPFFSTKERAALALTDAATRLAPGGVPDEVWNDVVAQWGKEGAAKLVFLVAVINTWNRVAIPARAQPMSFRRTR